MYRGASFEEKRRVVGHWFVTEGEEASQLSISFYVEVTPNTKQTDLLSLSCNSAAANPQ